MRAPFVIALFGTPDLDAAGLPDAALHIIQSANMLPAMLALTAIQAIDWLRDVRHRGLGADNLKTLMIKPYRRVVVLHLTRVSTTGSVVDRVLAERAPEPQTITQDRTAGFKAVVRDLVFGSHCCQGEDGSHSRRNYSLRRQDHGLRLHC